MFIVLPWIWEKNVATVIGRARVFTSLKPTPTSNSNKKAGAKTRYFIRKQAIRVYVIISLPSIWLKNVATVIEGATVLLS